MGGIALILWAAALLRAIPAPVQIPLPGPYEPAPSNAQYSPAPSVAPALPLDPASEDYRAALTMTLVAAQQANGSLTPRRLAEIYAGESGTIDEPAVFLEAMFKEWPLPPDAPIAHDKAGAFALTRYAETFAALERQVPVPFLRPALDRNTADDQKLRDAVTAFADGVVQTATTQSVATSWPSWLPWISFLPLIPMFFWTRLSTLPAFKAILTNPAVGARGVEADLPVEGLIMTAPPPARRLTRQIAWREPGIARRINPEASVRATIRRGGFLTLVPRLRRRTADYLFLVPRLRRDDHERDRVSRFIDALRRGGLSLDVYDYDPDPRTLYPRGPAIDGDDIRGRR